MFRKLAGLTAIAGLFITGVASAQGIALSAHNFSGDGWNGTGEICVVCHTAHNANYQAADQPLWDHMVTAATFAPYASDTLTASVDNAVGGGSKLCLSCHDGTVALDSFGGNEAGTTFITGTVLVGTSGADDHPVGFTYDTALATSDGGLYDPSATTSGLAGNIDADMLFGAGNDQLECGSCHDVHDEAGVNFLLRKSNANSALCLTCHNK